MQRQFVMTRGVADWCATSEVRDFVNEAIAEHLQDPEHGVCTEDGLENLNALARMGQGLAGRVLTSHIYGPSRKIWVITEWGDEAAEVLTTVLFPEEY